MSNTALKKELENVVAAWPAMPFFDLSTIANDNDHQAITALNRYAQADEHDMASWREQTLALIGKLEDLLAEADEAIPLQSLIATLSPAKERIDAVIENLESSMASDTDLYIALDALETIAPSSAQDVVKQIREKGRSLILKRLDVVRQIRDRLLRVIWEHDPDARGGPKFDKADDLIAFLEN